VYGVPGHSTLVREGQELRFAHVAQHVGAAHGVLGSQEAVGVRVAELVEVVHYGERLADVSSLCATVIWRRGGNPGGAELSS
jgi:hypothetical protein